MHIFDVKYFLKPLSTLQHSIFNQLHLQYRKLFSLFFISVCICLVLSSLPCSALSLLAPEHCVTSGRYEVVTSHPHPHPNSSSNPLQPLQPLFFIHCRLSPCFCLCVVVFFFSTFSHFFVENEIVMCNPLARSRPLFLYRALVVFSYLYPPLLAFPSPSPLHPRSSLSSPLISLALRHVSVDLCTTTCLCSVLPFSQVLDSPLPSSYIMIIIN